MKDLTSKMRRLWLLLLFLLLVPISMEAQIVLLTLDYKDAPLSSVLTEIGHQSSLSVVYNTKDVNKEQRVTIKVVREKMESVMSKLLSGTGISYSVKDNKYLVLFQHDKSDAASASAGESKRTIKGNVVDEKGEPMIGVAVKIKGGTSGVITDLDGNYAIQVESSKAVLEFTFVGYRPYSLPIAGRSTYNVVMMEDVKQLGEVVVTAMGIERKEKSLTYATQKVQGSELMKVQDANFVNSLQGKVSGLTIMQNAGGAGGASKIVLRGNKSVLGNNAALIVVDGIPMTNNISAQKSWGDGDGINYASSSEGSDPLSLINPDDIESINVLKGANAAALYGSAAANGVVMITTKKGKEGKISIAVSSNVTFEAPLLTPDIQNIYGSTVNLAAGSMTLDSWGKKMSDMSTDELAYGNAKLRNHGSNDVDDFFDTGVTVNNSVSLSGGTERIRSYASYANSHSNGMMPTNTYNRNTLSLRQSYTFLQNRLNVDASINYVHSDTKNRPGGGTSLNPIYDLYTMPRNVDMSYYKSNYCNEKGSWVSNMHGYYKKDGSAYQWVTDATVDLAGRQQIWFTNSNGHNNPYWLTRMNVGKVEEERIYGYVSARYEIYQGLVFQTRLNLDRTRYSNVTNRYATTTTPSGMEDYGIYGQDLIKTNEIYLDYLLSYNNTFGDFSLSGSAGGVEHTIKGNTQKIWASATTYDAQKRVLPTLVDFFEPSAGSGNAGDRSYYETSNWDKAALFTAQVGYKDMIFVDGSYRRDWYRAFKQFSSRGTHDNYGYFGVGANALVHRIIKLPEVITNLKVRSSYSEVGNSIPNILFSTVKNNYITGSVISSSYGYFDNPVPEVTKSFEAGFDLSLFKSALEIDFTYYNSSMHNAYLLNENGGGKVTPVNSGVIRNSGIESTVTYSMNILSNLLWKTGVNISYNDNEIVKTYHNADGSEALIEQSIAGGKIKVRYKEGGSFGDMYARDFARDANGKILLTSDGTPSLSSDYTYIGNMNSKVQLGWSNTFTYKNFSLYFLINGKFGGKVISFTEAELDRLGLSQRTANARLAAEADPSLVWNGQPALYMPDGQLAPIKGYYQTIGGDVNATQYIYDATNFRLRELSVGYTFRSLFGNSKDLSLSFIGRNLFFLYKKAPVDPDISLSTQNGLSAFEIFNMPSARSYGVSLTATF